MLKTCDVLIVGAATTGIYFGWLMAKKGHSVLVVDKEEREQVGQRLEVIHLDKETFEELDIPPPTEAPELIGSWKGIWVSRLPLFFQRMYKILEDDGVQFEFSCNFKELIFENGQVSSSAFGGSSGARWPYLIIDQINQFPGTVCLHKDPVER